MIVSACVGICSVAAIMLVTVSDNGTAQLTTRRPQSNPDSVRLVADLFFRAVADEQWNNAALLIDTNVVRQHVLQRLRWRTDYVPREPTIEEFMRDDPAKPRAVAEYELKRFREQTAKAGPDGVTYEFAGVESLDELVALSAREATARFLQAQDDRVRVRAMMKQSGCPASAFSWPFMVHRILGAVLVSDTLAFVLHQDSEFAGSRGADLGMPGPSVMQLRLRGGQWRILPAYDLLRRLNSGIGGVTCDSTTRRPRPS